MTVRTFWCLPILAFCTALALALITPQSGASAQQGGTPAGPNAAQTEVLQDLVVTLRDEEARRALIERIEALIEASESAEDESKPPEPENFAGRLLAAATPRLQATAEAKASTEGAGAGASGSKTSEKAAVGATYQGGMAVFTMAKGGLMYAATIAGQKSTYKTVKK